MEEEVTQHVLTICVQAGKMTEKVLADAISSFLRYQNCHNNKVKAGKQSYRQLMSQNAGAVSIEIKPEDIKSFNRVARKYHIDYAFKKDKSCDPPKYFVFFKARDETSMSMAFNEYVKKQSKEQSRPSIREKLRQLRDATLDKGKDRQMERVKAKTVERGQSL